MISYVANIVPIKVQHFIFYMSAKRKIEDDSGVSDKKIRADIEPNLTVTQQWVMVEAKDRFEEDEDDSLWILTHLLQTRAFSGVSQSFELWRQERDDKKKLTFVLKPFKEDKSLVDWVDKRARNKWVQRSERLKISLDDALSKVAAFYYHFEPGMGGEIFINTTVCPNPEILIRHFPFFLSESKYKEGIIFHFALVHFAPPSTPSSTFMETYSFFTSPLLRIKKVKIKINGCNTNSYKKTKVSFAKRNAEHWLL